jgi:hypothetical protein
VSSVTARRPTGTLAVAAVTAAVALVAVSIGVAAQGATAPPAPCGTRTGPPATYAHVIWIWMENHSADQIVGNRSAKYINSLVKNCGLASNYTAIAHPSLPNYIAATSGDTQGVDENRPPTSYPLGAVSIFEQAPSVKSYQESMPTPCALSDSGRYAARHNPAAYYTRIAASCARDNLPMGTTSGGAFASALAGDTLPAFSFVTPNLCNDMHDCSVKKGDSWLKKWVAAITASPSYRAGDTALFIVWDEDDYNGVNRVVAIVVSPYTTAGTVSATPFTHYSLLRTTEELLGISERLGGAASAASMRSAFGF